MNPISILLSLAALLLVYQLFIRTDENDEELDRNGEPKKKKRLF